MEQVSQPEVPSTPVTAVPADATVVDVREDDEWAAGHATGALHVPLSQLPQRASEIPDGTIYPICKSGGRSAQATAWLNQHGREAVNVEGGTTAWLQEGKPMTSENAGEPTVL